MTEEEAKEYLKETLEEIEENHKNGELILVQKSTTKELKEAIEVILKEIEEREKRYWKREERFLDMYNREKEKHEEIYNDLLDERDDNYIPKDKIRELLKNNYDIYTENSRSISVEGAFAFVDEIEELLEEEE